MSQSSVILTIKALLTIAMIQPTLGSAAVECVPADSKTYSCQNTETQEFSEIIKKRNGSFEIYYYATGESQEITETQDGKLVLFDLETGQHLEFTRTQDGGFRTFNYNTSKEGDISPLPTGGFLTESDESIELDIP